MAPKTYLDCFRTGDWGGIVQCLEEVVFTMLIIGGPLLCPRYWYAFVGSALLLTVLTIPLYRSNMRRWKGQLYPPNVRRWKGQ